MIPSGLLIIVEHFPDVVLETVQKSPEMYEWFINEWVHLVAVNPETRELHLFKNGGFTCYCPMEKTIDSVADITALIETNADNLPVYSLS